MDDDRDSYVCNVIAHRCPELDPDDIAAAYGVADAEDMLPMSALEMILDALTTIEERMEALEARMTGQQGTLQ